MINQACYCQECGKLLVVISSGAVCPDGHGRIHVDVTRAEIGREKRAAAKAEYLAILPRCRKLLLRSLESAGSSRGSRLWVIDGIPGLFAFAWSDPPAILAYHEATKRRVWLVKKFGSVEELVQPSQGG